MTASSDNLFNIYVTSSCEGYIDKHNFGIYYCTHQLLELYNV